MRRVGDLVLTVAILGLAALAAVWFEGSPSVSVEGSARIADGDSLVLDGRRIRLEGIDAPELDQRCTRGAETYACGRDARDALAKLAGRGTIVCEGTRHDRYDRLLARCISGGRILNEAMVERGWAVAYGLYDNLETQARRAGRGLWAGDFERPQDWRRGNDGAAEVSHDALAGIGDWLRGRLSGMLGEER